MLQVITNLSGSGGWRQWFGSQIGLATAAVLLFALLDVITGRIDIEGGVGWDGEHYVRFLSGDLAGVSQNVLLRPLVPLLNAPAYLLTRDVLVAFEVMSYVYVFVLCLALCSIYDAYSGDRGGKSVLVLNLFMSVAVAKMFAFYPTLIDLGACAVIAIATRIVLSAHWRLAAVAGVLAVLSREFGIIVVAFGCLRQLRTTGRVGATVLTWSPAVLTMLTWRLVVSRHSGPVMLEAAGLLANIEYWTHPTYPLLFVYFVLTVFGGISLAIALVPRELARSLGKEPEWIIFGLIIPVAALTADIWRYLLYVVPAVTALFAALWERTPQERRRVYATTVLGATMITQRPWAPVDEFVYFRDWFPFYGPLGWVAEDLPVEMFPLWAWRVGILVLLAGLLLLVRRPASVRWWRLAIRSVAALALLCGAVWTVGYRPVLRPPSVGPREATVRWAASVDERTRRTLERQYRIAPYRDEGQRTWRYRFTGASRINELRRDPRVEDTHYFEVFDWRWRYTYYLELIAPARLSLVRRNQPMSG